MGREMLELCMENKFESLEDKVKDVISTADQLTELRIKSREESIRVMEKKVEELM